MISRRRPLAVAIALLSLWSCGRRADRVPDLPPGVTGTPGTTRDVCPRWSPDGRRIAFLRVYADRRASLCVASGDGKRLLAVRPPELLSPDRPIRRSRSSGLPLDGPSWSADGKTIAVQRLAWFDDARQGRLPGLALYATDELGRGDRPLAVHPPDYRGELVHFRSPAWSPDGRRFAFVAEGVAGETVVYVRNLISPGPTVPLPRYDRGQDASVPAWSPDGRRLAFRQGILRSPAADPVETVRVIEPGRGHARRILTLTTARYRALVGLPGDERVAPKVTGLAWSPDGSRLAATVTTTPGGATDAGVWLLDAQGARPPVCVAPPRTDATYCEPVWLGRRGIGVVRVRVAGPCEVVWLDADRRTPARVVARLPSDDFDWSPDRRRIVSAASETAGPAAPTTLRVLSIAWPGAGRPTPALAPGSGSAEWAPSAAPLRRSARLRQREGAAAGASRPRARGVRSRRP